MVARGLLIEFQFGVVFVFTNRTSQRLHVRTAYMQRGAKADDLLNACRILKCSSIVIKPCPLNAPCMQP